MKLLSFILLFSLFAIHTNCAKTIIKISNPTAAPVISQEDYKKTYINNFDGLFEFTRPVTPNKPQVFRGRSSQAEKDRHVTPVCTADVETIVIYPDWIDSLIHFALGGIVSSRSVLIYCNK